MVEQLQGLLRSLTPRLYSIASSQAEVDQESPPDAGRGAYPQGLVALLRSTLRALPVLADRLPVGGDVRVFVEHNDNFRLPGKWRHPGDHDWPGYRYRTVPCFPAT